MTTSPLVIKNKKYAKANHAEIVAGSSKRFRGVPESEDYITQRPLLLDAWSQTTVSDFSFFKLLELTCVQPQREKELEEKVRELQNNLGKYRELLEHIRATSMKMSALLEQQHWENHFTDNTGSNDNNGHSFSNNRCTQLSPRIVNSNHQSTSPTENLKYTIIAENSGEPIYEPTEIHLAEEDGALNLNGSADYGWQEIFVTTPDENAELKTEHNTATNTMRTDYQPVGITPNTTPIEHHLINRRNLTAEQQKISIANTHNECNTTIETFKNIRLKLPTIKPKIVATHIFSPAVQSTPKKYMQPFAPYHNLPQSANGIDADNAMVQIGPNNTHIPKDVYDNINWSSASAATRKLLMTIFGRNVLATHSMTGRPSPAFMDRPKPVKQMLDPAIVSDISFEVTRKCNVSAKEVRLSITTKCADENKMMRLQMNKRKRAPMKEINRNNNENLT